MPENEPQSLASVVDAVMNDLVARCQEPRAADFKKQFDEDATEVRQRFDTWRSEALSDRTRYHETCGLPKAEAVRKAEADVSLLAGAAAEERESLIAHHWGVFLRRLQGILEEEGDQD